MLTAHHLPTECLGRWPDQTNDCSVLSLHDNYKCMSHQPSGSHLVRALCSQTLHPARARTCRGLRIAQSGIILKPVPKPKNAHVSISNLTARIFLPFAIFTGTPVVQWTSDPGRGIGTSVSRREPEVLGLGFGGWVETRLRAARRGLLKTPS